MKKAILSLAAFCMLTAFSSANVYQQPFNNQLNGTANLVSLSNMEVNSVFCLFTLTPVTYRNLMPNAGYVVIDDITTGQSYGASLPPTTGSHVGNTGIQLSMGDMLQVTVYSGNGNCSITCNGETQTGVSSMYISQSFLPNPSWIVIQ